MSVDDFAIVEAIGITVVPVDSLRSKVVLVQSHDVALVRPDLDDDDRATAIGWLIQAAAAR